jgi:hypothetical protein
MSLLVDPAPMSTQSLPAFRCRVGTWRYYVSTMTCLQLARWVVAPSTGDGSAEVGSPASQDREPRTVASRGGPCAVDDRAPAALVLAVRGGEPKFASVCIEGVGPGVDGPCEDIGILTFDGTHSYLVLHGRDRVDAMLDAVRARPEIGSDEIGVLIVQDHDSPTGRAKVQGLISDLSKTAR